MELSKGVAELDLAQTESDEWSENVYRINKFDK